MSQNATWCILRFKKTGVLSQQVFFLNDSGVINALLADKK